MWGMSDYFQGHLEGSPYWWGDLCASRIEYVRNLTFAQINLRTVNPTMPYRDKRRPHVRWWYSASDAEDADAFAKLLSERNQEQLEHEGGVCIVATHFGKRFCSGGSVRPDVARALERIAARPGWFPNVGVLLDWMRERNTSVLSSAEWRRMQRMWFRDTVLKSLSRVRTTRLRTARQRS